MRKKTDLEIILKFTTLLESGTPLMDAKKRSGIYQRIYLEDLSDLATHQIQEITQSYRRQKHLGLTQIRLQKPIS